MTKRILIVDDEQDIRRIVQAALEKLAGWQTIVVGTGQEGLRKAKVELPDAIVLDISMPDMDGIEFYEHLQADAVTRCIPVVLLTAKVLPQDHQIFSQMGVAGVIPKPFNPITIGNQVAEILGW